MNTARLNDSAAGGRVVPAVRHEHEGPGGVDLDVRARRLA